MVFVRFILLGVAGVFLADFDDGFDGTHGRVGELSKFFGDFVDGDAVGDPDVGVDFFVFDELDDFREIAGVSVSRRE